MEAQATTAEVFFVAAAAVSGKSEGVHSQATGSEVTTCSNEDD